MTMINKEATCFGKTLPGKVSFARLSNAVRGVLVVVGTFLIAANGLFAQNPLRAQSSNRADQDLVNRYVTQNKPPSRHYDSSVSPASFAEPVRDRVPPVSANRIQGGGVWQDGLQAGLQEDLQEDLQGDLGQPLNFVEREKLDEAKDTPSASSELNFGQLISKIGMNLAVVLMIAIGFVLAAKTWIRSGKVDASSRDEKPADFKVKATFSLDHKTTLRMIEFGQREILIASDLHGVKSMLALPPTFQQSMEETSRPVPESSGPRESMGLHAIRKFEEAKTQSSGIDEKLIKMLLENANRTSARNS